MQRLRYFFRGCFIVILMALVAVSLGSCKMAKNQMVHDRPADKEFQDYRDALAPVPPPAGDAAPAPDFRPIVSVPADMNLPSPLVTVSVNQTVSLRDLMFELAEQSGVDMELDPQIRGSIIFTAKNRPFNEVIGRICEMAGLSYKFRDGVLRVELDRPYVKDYKIDYVNASRKSTSSINSSISVSGAGGDASTSAGSSASISNDFDSNFWREIDDGLKQILTASDTYLSLATLADPVATAATQAPVVDINNPTPPPLPGSAPPALNVAQAAAVPLAANPPATYSISKETGIVSVFASERQHKLVKKFFANFRRISTSQILIEAKVLEVALSDEFASGIDWSTIQITGMADVTAAFASPGFSPPGAGAFTAALQLGRSGVAPVISALARFGTVRALSSPRVTVMNSQPAVVNVTNNRVFFSVVTTFACLGGPPCVTVPTSTSTAKTTPEGVMMNVLPTANPDTGEIILSIRPTVSRITDTVQDPVNLLNFVPEMSVQEIDSVIKIQSGQTVVMGGLMRDDNNVSREGIPLLGEMPLIGALFRNHSDIVRKSELVILLRATIVPGANADDEDRKIYKEFGLDRRPVRL